MFSFFKSKSPLGIKKYLETLHTVAISIAETAINEAKSSQQLSIKYLNASQSKSVADAAFRYWIFHLHLIHISLMKNMKENEDKASAIFVDPIFEEIYNTSEISFRELADILGDAKVTKVDGSFRDLAEEQLSYLRTLPLIVEENSPKLGLVNSSVNLTLTYAYSDLSCDLDACNLDFLFTLHTVSIFVKYTVRYSDFYKELFTKIRIDMNK